MNNEPNHWLTAKIVGLLARITPRCHDMTRLISRSQDADLPVGTRVKMRMHYWICAWCVRYRDQVRFVRKALHVCPEPQPSSLMGKLPADARQRLKQALNNAR